MVTAHATRRQAPAASGTGPGRRGFTLVELLAVIAIIAILISLIVPAVMSGYRTAREGAVTSEINGLAQALAAFKTAYDDYPPSRLILVESGNYAGVNAPSGTALQAYLDSGPALGHSQTPAGVVGELSVARLYERSYQSLKRLFPQLNLSSTGPVDATGTFFYDFNGNGTNQGNTPIYLTGDECLAFFLGGLPNPDGQGGFAMIGFAKNPRNPFSRASSNRTDPFFEFKPGQLVDFDGDGIPSYCDPLGSANSGDARPYAYFSAYGNGQYDPNDCNYNLNESSTYLFNRFRVTGGPTPLVDSPFPNPYTSSVSAALDPSANAQPVNYFNPQTFQIISSGYDRNFGVGGQYLPEEGGDKLPYYDYTSVPAVLDPTGTNDRAQREGDNLTNFATGRLN